MRFQALLLAAAVGITAVTTGCGSGEAANPIAAESTTTPADNAKKAALASQGVDLDQADWDDQTGAAAVEVDAVDNNFDHQYTEVKAGTKVTFRNDGHNEHNVVPVQKGKGPDIATDAFQPGTQTEVTFDEPGDYAYYCSLHGTPTKGMTGAIRVVE